MGAARLAASARGVGDSGAVYKDVADGRGTIGWYHRDEADLYGPPEALPFHPPWQQTKRVTFLTLSGHVYSGSAGIPAGRGVYPKFIARADMIGFDLYPLQVWCRRDAFPAVYEAQRELAALAGARATYQWIEVGRMEFCNGRAELDPTPLTIRAETWLAIAGGARGIGYFPDHWQPPVAHAITQLNTEISALGPALLARGGSGDGFGRPGARRRASLQRRDVPDRGEHLVAAGDGDRRGCGATRSRACVRREPRSARPERSDARSLRPAAGARLRRRSVEGRRPRVALERRRHAGAASARTVSALPGPVCEPREGRLHNDGRLCDLRCRSDLRSTTGALDFGAASALPGAESAAIAIKQTIPRRKRPSPLPQRAEALESPCHMYEPFLP